MRSLRLLAASAMLAGVPGVADAQPAIVVLVRHAERAPTPAADPVLTEAGDVRALALADALADAGVTHVVVTQFARTRLTAEPLARRRNLAPQVVAARGPVAEHAASVAAAVRALPREAVVLVVGHSNTIPAIVAALGGPSGPDLCDGEYDTMFLLHLTPEGPPRTVRSRYGAADPDGSDDCARTMKMR